MPRMDLSRRGVLRAGAATGVGLAMPTFFTSKARAYTNEPTGSTVTLGFNVPQTGPYADEGADELRAYELAVEHLNGEGADNGMLETFVYGDGTPTALSGQGIAGKKVEYVTGDTQTKSDAARASAQSMIQKDGAVMITGGSSSSVAIAVQSLCHEAGVMFMAGLTHSNDTTGKDRRANGFRHFFNSYMSGAALAPVLANAYGTDRKAYYLTADYNWGHPLAIRSDSILTQGQPSSRLIGDSQPAFSLGWNMDFELGGFSASMLWDMTYDFDIYNYDRHWAGHSHHTTDQGGKPASEKKPMSYENAFSNYNNRYAEDGSYLKLRELAIDYTFNQERLTALFGSSVGNSIQQITVGVAGSNLLTFTDYSGYDPEVSSTGNTKQRRDGLGDYPNYRRFTGKLTFTF